MNIESIPESELIEEMKTLQFMLSIEDRPKIVTLYESVIAIVEADLARRAKLKSRGGK